MDQVFSAGFVIEESAVGGVLSRLGVVAQAGFRSLAIDATMVGRRPRELDVGARSDLRRTVLQHGLNVAAVTFRIPPEHFVREDTADRACAAAVQAIGFAESMSAHWVALPVVGGEAGLVIQQEAERRGRQVLTIGGTDRSAMVEVVGSDAPELAMAFRLVAESASALQLPFAVFAGLRAEHGFPKPHGLQQIARAVETRCPGRTNQRGRWDRHLSKHESQIHWARDHSTDAATEQYRRQIESPWQIPCRALQTRRP